jgi:hypothetical protein
LIVPNGVGETTNKEHGEKVRGKKNKHEKPAITNVQLSERKRISFNETFFEKIIGKKDTLSSGFH